MSTHTYATKCCLSYGDSDPNRADMNTATIARLRARVAELTAFVRQVAATPTATTPYVAWDMREQAAKVLGGEG